MINVEELKNIVRKLSKQIDDVDKIVNQVLFDELCRKCELLADCDEPPCRKYRYIEMLLIMKIMSDQHD